MKLKWIPIIAVLVVGLALAGCQASTSTSVPAGSTASTQLTDSETLALGTLKLENTPQAVNAAQAVELLTLWKAVQSLSTSATITSQEMDALYAQIREAMTADQLAVIDAMRFTTADIEQIKSTLGVGIDASTRGTTGTVAQVNAPSGMPGDGMGAPPDAAGMDVGGFSPQADGASSTTASGEASSAPQTRGNVFLEPLISILKEKAATASG